MTSADCSQDAHAHRPERQNALMSGAGIVAEALAALAVTWTAIVAVLICTEVVARSVFNSPITGVTEFIALSVPPVVFMQLPKLILTGRLFRVELLTGRLDPRRPDHAVFGAVYATVLLVILAVFCPWVTAEAVDALNEGDYVGSTGAFAIPTGPFLAMTVLGSVCGGLAALLLLGANLATLARAGSLRNVMTWRVGLLVSVLLGFGVTVAVLPSTPLTIGTVFVAALFVFLLLGFPIATMLILLTVLGIYLIQQSFRVTELSLGIAMTRSIANFEFAVVPLFVAMGLVLDKARLGEDAFSVAAHLLRRVRGGLAIATVAANAVFASVVGSSIASAAVFSRVAVGPMEAAGYSKRRAVGTVAGSSVLGMLIPPSLLLIVFGLSAEQSIGRLFFAAIVPGLLLALVFSGVAWAMAPKELTPSRATPAESGGMSVVQMGRRLGPVALLVAVVLGGIYSGWFTPTEAAGVGLALAVCIALARRTISLKQLARTFVEAGTISAAMLILMAAASAYTRLLAFSQLPMKLNDALVSADFGLVLLMLSIVVVALLLGAVLDSVSIILVLTPIALPLVLQAGADPIWFGVVLVIAVEVGLLTPPFGLSAFTVREVLSERGIELADVFIGALPFVAAMLAVIVLLVLAPGLVTMIL